MYISKVCDGYIAIKCIILKFKMWYNEAVVVVVVIYRDLAVHS